MNTEAEVLAFGETERDFSSVDKARVIEALSRVLPPGTLIYDAEDLRPYECDGLAAYRALPLVVALPTTEEQVVAVLRICFELGVPVVARGAGTGLSGGALPHTRGVLLSLARFNRILKLDPLARTAIVQPGVPPRTACTTRPTLPLRSPARSVATWPRTLAAYIASSTD